MGLNLSDLRAALWTINGSKIKFPLQFIAQILGMEDDVLVEFIFNQLDTKDPDPRKMQINLTGFVNGKNARIFMGELWSLLDSAQNTESGNTAPWTLISRGNFQRFFEYKHERDLAGPGVYLPASEPEVKTVTICSQAGR